MFLKSASQIGSALAELVHVVCRGILVTHPVIALELAALFVRSQQRLDTPGQQHAHHTRRDQRDEPAGYTTWKSGLQQKHSVPPR